MAWQKLAAEVARPSLQNSKRHQPCGALTMPYKKVDLNSAYFVYSCQSTHKTSCFQLVSKFSFLAVWHFYVKPYFVVLKSAL